METAITIADISSALAAQTDDMDWLSILAERFAIARENALIQCAAECGYDVLQGADAWGIEPCFDWIPYSEAAALQVLPGRDEKGNAVAVLSNPLDSRGSHRLANTYVAFAHLYVADPGCMRRHLESIEGSVSAVADVVAEGAVVEATRDEGDVLTLLAIQEESSPAIKLVSSTVFEALRMDASDVHLESVPQGMVVKFRIDGVLVKIASIASTTVAEQAIARIKVLAELDIAERRVPQDGRYRVSVKGREIDIRVSIMPSIHGEDAVLRILDKKALIDSVQRLTLDTLGFDPDTIRAIRRLAADPYGMLLVTGPTGSGKTTTLYAAITEINDGEDKFVTIEDPVEYQLPGVLQIPVNEKKGLTFALGLRSILRHDPDKILVGEIRDSETAQIAVQSALTGHMVFTSVHANNAFDVIGRFLHMGVDPYNFVSSLSGVVAQRLVRQLCPSCRKPVPVDGEIVSAFGTADLSGGGFFAASGCKSCRGTGYKGRRAIAEVLKLTDDIREMILARASIRALKQRAREDGMRTMREVALQMVYDGHTTIQEINRVTFAD
jgi:general secretion pathway protein E